MPGCSRSRSSSTKTRRRTSSAFCPRYDQLTTEERLICAVVLVLGVIVCCYSTDPQKQWNIEWMLNQTKTPPFEYSKITPQQIGNINCHLNYTDKCDFIGTPDQRGFYTCNFEHTLVIDNIKNHSHDADGVFDHHRVGYWKSESPEILLLSVAMKMRYCKSTKCCIAAVHLKINQMNNKAEGFYNTFLNDIGNMTGNCNTTNIPI